MRVATEANETWKPTLVGRLIRFQSLLAWRGSTLC